VISGLVALTLALFTGHSSARTDATTGFAVTASVSPDPMIIGDTATYHVVVTNTGASDATGVTTTMTITPDNAVTFGTLPAGCTASGQGVTCTDATLASGASVTYDIPVTVNPSLSDGTNLRFEATTRDAAGDTGSTPPGGLITQAHTQVDVGIVKSGPTQVDKDGTITYTLTVRNYGPSDAPQVFVHDPTDGNLVTITDLPAECPASGLTVSCDLGTLSPGETRTFTFTVTVNSSVAEGTVIQNCATVNVGKPDVNPDNNTSCADTTVGPSTAPVAELSIVKSAPAEVGEDGTIRYTVNITNHGPDGAGDVVVYDPANDIPATIVTLPGECDTADGTVTCHLGDLAAGVTKTIEVVAQADHGTAPDTVIENCSDVYSDTDDPDVNDNESCADTTVEETTPPPTADVVVTKDGPATAREGDTITYVVTVTNHGPDEATNVVVSDPIDETFLTPMAVPDGCAVTDGTVTCEAGTLAPGASASFRITATVSPDAEPGTQIDNCAEVRSTRTRLSEEPAPWCVETGVSGQPAPKPSKPVPPIVPVTG
jgi:uncharacterized repeat protein (TIGR01451 family)